jgi:uncharacterized protein
MPLEAGLLEILACPACHASLRAEEDQVAAAPAAAAPAADALGGELLCTGTPDCGLAYPIRDGIPVLLVDEARRPA